MFSVFLLVPYCAAQRYPYVPVAPNVRAQQGGFASGFVFSDRWWTENLAPVTVQYPYEDQEIAGPARAVNVRGKINIPRASLDINGVAARVEPDGRFQAYVPVEQGRFALLLTARGEQGPVQAVRHVVVSGASRAAAEDAWEEFAAVPAEVTREMARLRSSAASSGNLTAHQAACGEVMVNGRKGRMCRISLGGGEAAWLEEEYLHLKPLKTPAENRVSGLNLVSSASATRLELGSRPVPLFVRESEDKLELVLYYSSGFNERPGVVRDALVRGVSWSSQPGNKIKFVLYFRPGVRPWGYDYRFENNKLVLELRHRPGPSRPDKPLSGRHILLDPGHSASCQEPFDGTVGASGYAEYEATLDLALQLRHALEEAGARVSLTRYDNFSRVSLADRQAAARRLRPDVMVSLHYDALPASADPFKGKRGFSVFYSYPHSRALAQSLYNAYRRGVPLPDNGLHQTDDLFIPRISGQPSVLVESAFLMLPQQEDMAKSREGRVVFVNALKEGLESFFAGLK